jgi:hypothetical protein
MTPYVNKYTSPWCCLLHSLCLCFFENFSLSSKPENPILLSTVAGDGKHKRAPTLSSESFGDSKHSEVEYSNSEGGTSSLPSRSPSSSSPVNTDNSMGLTTGEQAFLKVVEHPILVGSDESDKDEEETGEEEEGADDDKGITDIKCKCKGGGTGGKGSTDNNDDDDEGGDNNGISGHGAGGKAPST